MEMDILYLNKYTILSKSHLDLRTETPFFKTQATCNGYAYKFSIFVQIKFLSIVIYAKVKSKN